MHHIYSFIDLYDVLRNLTFPAPSVPRELKVKLLNPAFCRQVQTHELKEISRSGKRRPVKFTTSLCAKYSWLFIGNHGGYCIYCKLFCTSSYLRRQPGEFTAKPYVSFSRAKLCADHEATSYHQFSLQRALAFRSVVDSPDVIERLKGVNLEKERLHTIVKTLVFCGR